MIFFLVCVCVCVCELSIIYTKDGYSSISDRSVPKNWAFDIPRYSILFPFLQIHNYVFLVSTCVLPASPKFLFFCLITQTIFSEVYTFLASGSPLTYPHSNPNAVSERAVYWQKEKKNSLFYWQYETVKTSQHGDNETSSKHSTR